MKFKILPATLLLLMSFTNSSYAQNKINSEIWNKVDGTDRSIQKSMLKWTVTTHQEPVASLNPVETAASTYENLRRKGVNPKEAKKISNNHQILVEQMNKGYVINFKLNFMVDGNRIRAEKLGGDPLKLANHSADTIDNSHVLEYFDGTNNLQMIGQGAGNPNSATLQRVENQFLGFTAIGYAAPVILSRCKLTNYFNPKNSTLIKNSNGSYLMETSRSFPPIKIIVQLTLAAQDLAPLKLEYINSYTKHVFIRYTSEEFRTTSGNIRVPSRVRFDQLQENGKISSYNIYKLDSVVIGDTLNTSILHPLVPKGTDITDFRYGTLHGTHYKLKTDIPTDDEVLAQITKISKIQDKMAKEATLVKLGIATIIILGCILLLSVGLVIYRKIIVSKKVSI